MDLNAGRSYAIAAKHSDVFHKEYPQLDWTIHHMRVPELDHPQRLLHLAQAMHKRGYKTSTFEKVIGGNYARVFKEVVG